ncbi:MAG TPA: hypothetical protein DD725_11535 [Deltaproteobacteria bacterium]|nr:hypothetical protein [Deltaproteobacteria bacterium]
MTTEILIGIGGLLLSFLTYFAGVHRTEKRLSKDERNARIQNVLDKYMNFRRSNYTSGLDGLQKAGIATLSTDNEIIELIDMIVKHGEKNPLGSYQESLSKAGLKKFFDFAANHNINFFDFPVEEIIKKIEAV